MPSTSAPFSLNALAGSRLRRSLLYVPGDRAAMIAKASQRGADGLILNLEDAVAATHKETARQVVVQALQSHDFGRAEVVVRINPLATRGSPSRKITSLVFRALTAGILCCGCTPCRRNGGACRLFTAQALTIGRNYSNACHNVIIFWATPPTPWRCYPTR